MRWLSLRMCLKGGCVMRQKSVLAVEGMSATVYARGFYSFMDMHQPLGRQIHILQILKPALILCDEKNRKAAQ